MSTMKEIDNICFSCHLPDCFDTHKECKRNLLIKDKLIYKAKVENEKMTTVYIQKYEDPIR